MGTLDRAILRVNDFESFRLATHGQVEVIIEYFYEISVSVEFQIK